MIYNSSIGEIDLSKLTRLYPAAVVEMQGDEAEMSLEWIEMNEGKVNLKEYILVFDFTPPKEEIKDKKTLHFKTKAELIKTMQEVAQFFQP
ncbi:hypothetical protein M947_02165 [Sulfurimonas hongkongensis]|uniref:Phosphomannomutase n=1 Tax=Sulfurimonas hongkongensis TaxID=1172190 RepID=T0KUI7_9BACT|nr:hypothetical protein [Sulfurimonas hongkongensis]EQB40634.1 hypothetical protein M947_02165 [Sulfurimonas hongkongensis]